MTKLKFQIKSQVQMTETASFFEFWSLVLVWDLPPPLAGSRREAGVLGIWDFKYYGPH